jgi:hypothetical protein
MKYEIEVSETLSRIIKVDADYVDEALDKVEDDYNKENIVLNSKDYVNVEFRVL